MLNKKGRQFYETLSEKVSLVCKYMIEEMYRVHNKSIIIYIKIITDVIFIQI